jgi:TolB-like protein
MRRRGFQQLVPFVVLILLVSCQSANVQQKKTDEVRGGSVDQALLDLKNQLMEGLGEGQKPVLVIVDFVDPEGRITGLGRYIAEEILTHLVRDKKLRVVERRYLEKTMNEIKLGMSGLVSDDTAKSVGKIVGADAILTGSYTQVGQSVKIQARMIDVETGNVLASGSSGVDKDQVANLIRQVVEEAPATQPKATALLSEKLGESVQSQSVTAEGVSSIRSGQEDIARDNAVDDALRKAVEQGVGVFVESETLVENYQLVNDRILSQSRGYVRSYQIVKEQKEANQIRVTVNAEVTLGDLRKDLDAIGALLSRKHKPRIMVMIAEWNAGQSGYFLSWRDAEAGSLSVAENAMMERLSQKGFLFVDLGAVPTVIQRLEKAGASYGKADLTPDQVRTLGKKLDAEVVIVGKAKASQAGEIKNLGDFSMKSVQADLMARAVKTDTGEVIASASAKGTAAHINTDRAGTQAIEKAANELAEKMAGQILDKFSSEVHGTTSVRMIIQGLNHQELTRFKSIIKSQVRGIQDIHQRSFEGGVAQLDIDLKGNAQAMADELSTIQFESFVVKVNGVTANSIQLTATRKE